MTVSPHQGAVIMIAAVTTVVDQIVVVMVTAIIVGVAAVAAAAAMVIGAAAVTSVSVDRWAHLLLVQVQPVLTILHRALDVTMASASVLLTAAGS